MIKVLAGPSGKLVHVTTPYLDLSREQPLAHRRRAGALDERLSPGRTSLERAAWAGLQDSMPRAAVLSVHARVAVPSRQTCWASRRMPPYVTLSSPRRRRTLVSLAPLGHGESDELIEGLVGEQVSLSEVVPKPLDVDHRPARSAWLPLTVRAGTAWCCLRIKAGCGAPCGPR
jgi:hypothetical protein